jgi:hypothetical protein
VPDATLFAAAISQTEWRSLLGLGELRISRRRVQEVHVPPTPKERSRLFAWAPTTLLGDATDTLVIELADNWLADSKRHPAHPSEIVVIGLGQVFAHHSVSSEAHSYLSGDATKEGIELSACRYESVWDEWNRQREVSADLAAAETLIRVFGMPVDLKQKRADGYGWHDIVKLAQNSKTSVRSKPKHIETLLRSVRQISDAAAGVHSTGAYALAVNIEWIATRLNKDPLTKKALRTGIEEALEAGRAVGWSLELTTCPAVAQALTDLAGSFPRAYTSGVSPEMVALTNRLVMAAKEQSLLPIDVAVAVRHLLASDSTESASNLCVAVSGALGPITTRKLGRALGAMNPTTPDWSGQWH